MERLQRDVYPVRIVRIWLSGVIDLLYSINDNSFNRKEFGIYKGVNGEQ